MQLLVTGSNTYSMQFIDAMVQHLTRKQNFANFLTQLDQYCLRMNEHNSRMRDALKDNIIDHVYNDDIMDTISFCDSKLIAIAMAAHNNAIDWNSTINDNDVIPQNELNTRIDNLVRVIYRNVDPMYSRTSLELIMKDRDAYEQFFNIRMPKYLLQKTKQKLFDNPQLTVDDFKKLISKIRRLYLNHDIEGQEYKELLDWLLYCSINKLISSFPNNARISDIVNCINDGDLNNININMHNYNKYREITRVILKALTHFISYRIYKKNQNTCGAITIMVNCFNAYNALKKRIIQYIQNSLRVKYNNNININNESIVIDNIRQLFIDAFNSINITDQWHYYVNKVFNGNYRVITDLNPVIRNIDPVNKMELKMKEIICRSKKDFFLEKLFDHINY